MQRVYAGHPKYLFFLFTINPKWYKIIMHVVVGIHVLNGDMRKSNQSEHLTINNSVNALSQCTTVQVLHSIAIAGRLLIVEG